MTLFNLIVTLITLMKVSVCFNTPNLGRKCCIALQLGNKQKVTWIFINFSIFNLNKLILKFAGPTDWTHHEFISRC
jgi:hypothetical protein